MFPNKRRTKAQQASKRAYPSAPKPRATLKPCVRRAKNGGADSAPKQSKRKHRKWVTTSGSRTISLTVTGGNLVGPITIFHSLTNPYHLIKLLKRSQQQQVPKSSLQCGILANVMQKDAQDASFQDLAF